MRYIPLSYNSDVLQVGRVVNMIHILTYIIGRHNTISALYMAYRHNNITLHKNFNTVLSL